MPLKYPVTMNANLFAMNSCWWYLCACFAKKHLVQDIVCLFSATMQTVYNHAMPDLTLSRSMTRAAPHVYTCVCVCQTW